MAKANGTPEAGRYREAVAAAKAKLHVAKEHFAHAQRLLDRAAQEVCSVLGLGREHTALTKLYYRADDLGKRLANATPTGLDHVPKPGCGCGCWGYIQAAARVPDNQQQQGG